MKYVALVYSNPGAFEALSAGERDELMSEADAYLKEFSESESSSVKDSRSPTPRLAGRCEYGTAFQQSPTDRSLRRRSSSPASMYSTRRVSSGRPRSSPTTRLPASGL